MTKWDGQGILLQI